jgi:hypothetical protein
MRGSQYTRKQPSLLPDLTSVIFLFTIQKKRSTFVVKDSRLVCVQHRWYHPFFSGRVYGIGAYL